MHHSYDRRRTTDRPTETVISLNLKKHLNFSALKAYSLHRSSLPPSRNRAWRWPG
nr:MAG TPA: hypothetical protein [Caudoviricetes sp.]